MDGLDEFEKSLAAERAQRERAEFGKEERRNRRHRDRDERHRSDGHRSTDHNGSKHGSKHSSRKERERPGDFKNAHSGHAEDGHRSKRSRHARGASGHRSGNEARDAREIRFSGREVDSPSPIEEDASDLNRRPPKPLARDAWMTSPSGIEVDYVYRKQEAISKRPAPKDDPKRVFHHRELNTDLMEGEDASHSEEPSVSASRDVQYVFGDEGSSWRMTKLKAVYTLAEESHRHVDDVALERFGSLQEFDDAREEQAEMEKRRTYGPGYFGKEKPTGELYRERRLTRISLEGSEATVLSSEPVQGEVVEDPAASLPAVDQSTLNRLRAQMMKAKIRGGPEASKLEEEYQAASSAAATTGAGLDRAVVLDATHSRMLSGPRGEVKDVDTKRGRKRLLVEQNDEMSVDDMIREERRTRGQPGGEGLRLAERIAKDAKFDDDLEYLDENAEKLAKRVHKTEASLKDTAVTEYQKLNKILDKCPLCHHEDRPPPQDTPQAPLISLGTRVYLTLATEPELTGAEGGAVIVPINHRQNLLECDDDEWEEMRNFMKSLTRMYHDQGREVIFYENAATPHRHLHAALVAVPVPYELGDTAPAFFREAMLSADEEWSQHKKIINTGKMAREGLGKLAFRRSVAKEMPYFHVWFNLDGGLGHVVEDADRWPRGDLFAREILGSMLDCEPDVIKKQGRWSRSDGRLEGFRKRWRKFDWTRVLTEAT